MRENVKREAFHSRITFHASFCQARFKGVDLRQKVSIQPFSPSSAIDHWQSAIDNS